MNTKKYSLEELFVISHENKFKKAINYFNNNFNLDKNFLSKCLVYCKDDKSKRKFMNQYKLLMLTMDAKIFVGPNSNSIFIIYPNNKIYALGTSKHYQLGNGENDIINTPEWINPLPDEDIKGIYPTMLFTIFLTKKNKLYIVGTLFQDNYYQKYVTPKFIDYQHKNNIKKICILKDYVMIITEDYKLFRIALRDKNFKIIEQSNNVIIDNTGLTTTTFTDRNFFGKLEIIDICGLGNNYYLLTNDRRLFFIKLNDYNEDIVKEKIYIREIGNVQKYRIKKIGIFKKKYDHVILLTEDKKIYLYRDYGGALTSLQAKEKFIDFFYCRNRFIAVSETGKVYVYGDNNYGRLLMFKSKRVDIKIEDLHKQDYKRMTIDYNQLHIGSLEHNKLLDGIKKFYLTATSTYYLDEKTGFIMNFGTTNKSFIGIGEITKENPVNIVNKTQFKKIDMFPEEFRKKLLDSTKTPTPKGTTTVTFTFS
jgi:alpha-tubulin suppressor-like RCC1 family protein